MADTSIQIKDVDWSKSCFDSKGSILMSKNFSWCSALILRNRQNLDSILAHSVENQLEKNTMINIGNLLKKSLSVDQKRVYPWLDTWIDTIVDTYDNSPVSWYNRMMSDITNCNDLPKDARSIVDREEYYENTLRELNKANKIEVCYILGGLSLDKSSRFKYESLIRLGLDISRKIEFPYGPNWDITYDPNNSKVYVNLIEQEKTLEFDF